MTKTILKILCLSIAFVHCLNLLAQRNEEPSFHEIQAEREAHFEKIKQENNGDLKGKGYTPYKRWEWFWEQRITKNGKMSDAVKGIDAYRRSEQANTRAGSYSCNSSGGWTELGPNVNPTLSNYQGGIGMFSFLTFHPNYNNTTNKTMFTGGPSGLFKSTDGGDNWTVLNTDGLEVSGCKDLAISPNNPNVMYLATGIEIGSVGASIVYGSPYQSSVGLYKTIDGGLTWQFSGPSATPWSAYDQKRIGKVMVHPNDGNIVYVLSYYHSWNTASHWVSELHKSTNGGTTWTQILTTNETQPNAYPANPTSLLCDMEFEPNNPAVIYLAGHRLLKLQNDVVIADLTTQLSGVNIYGVPGVGHAERIEIAVTPANPAKVYAMAVGTTDTIINLHSLRNIWVSSNNGATFTAKNPTGAVSGGSEGYNINADAVYHTMSLSVSSTNEDVIYLGGIGLARSTNGGSTFTSLSNGSEVHPDNRGLACSPINGDQVFSCNDAGIFKSDNQGDNWAFKSNGLGVGRVYRLGITTTPTTASVDKTIVGFQDVTTLINTSGSSAWIQPNAWGDGMEAFFDYSNPNIVYRSAQNGALSYSINGGTTFIPIPGGYGYDNDTAHWVAPFTLDPNNHNILYSGRHDVFKKDVSNGSAPIKISNFTASFGVPTSRCLYLLQVAPTNSNIIYAGYQDGTNHDYDLDGNGKLDTDPLWNTANFQWVEQLFKTTDGGTTWTDITPNNVISKGVGHNMTDIVVHPQDPNKIWITYSGYFDFNWQTKKVFASKDGGLTWTDYSSGLPNMPVNTIVYNTSSDADELYVGTDVGVFYRNKFMPDWVCFSDFLPNIPVNDLEINPVKKIIRAGMFGRGVWESPLNCTPVYNLDLPTVVQPQSYYEADYITSTANIANNSNVGFKGHKSITFNYGFQAQAGSQMLAWIQTCTPFAQKTSENAENQAGRPMEQLLNINDLLISPNPFHTTANISYNLDSDAPVSLTVFDATGRLVSTLVDNQTQSAGTYSHEFDGSNLAAGMYICHLQTGDKVRVQKIMLVR